MSAAEPRLVLVVGVGRSGTSLMSGMLGQLGFHIPRPEVKANPSNPRGFGEPRWVVDFHTRLLRERRVTVNDARPAAWTSTGKTTGDPVLRRELGAWLDGHLRQAERIVVKDPRTVWFLPLWLACAEDLGVSTSFITMLRHPAEIVVSARKYYGKGQSEASRSAAWVNVILQTELATRGSRRAFVRYDNLLSDWVPEVRRVGGVLELPELESVDRDTHPETDAFVDPSLHRNRIGWDELDVSDRVRELADGVWDQLLGLTRSGGDGPAATALFDTGRSRYQALYGEAEAIAQSSVFAASRRRPRAAAGGGERARPPLWVRAARRVPPGWRRRLRRAAKRLRSRP